MNRKRLWGPYRAEYVKNYDADTITIRFEVWADVWVQRGVRLLGIDTPEKGFRAKSDYERNLATQASEYVTDLLANGNEITVTIQKKGKYGRLLSILEVDGLCLNDDLVDRGFAYAYFGGKRQEWVDSS